MNSPSKDAVLTKRGARFVGKWIDAPLQSVKFDTSVEDGKVAVITLSRPKNRNAWTEYMRNEVAYCLDQASKLSKVRVVIITGDPEGKAFCAGADLSPSSADNPMSVEGDTPEGRPADINYWRDGGGQAALAVVRSTKPVIAAVNGLYVYLKQNRGNNRPTHQYLHMQYGSAVGVGMTLPLSCDISVAAEDAKVGFVFGKRGLTMEALSSYFLERCVGHKIAMELVLTGRVFKAKDAPAGLFNYVVPQDHVMDKALSLAKEICQTSAMSSMINRNLIIRNGYNTSPEEAHLVESKSIFWMTQNADSQEGIKSFLEKRDPAFPLDPFKDCPPWLPWWKEVSTKSKL